MQISNIIMPLLIIVVFIFALVKKVDAYDSFIKGIIVGYKSSIKILPYLLSMYIAITVLRASGIFNDILGLKNVPVSLIIQGLLKPFTNSGSMAFMLETFNTYGVDSKYGLISSVIQGASDSSIYIMALYFGSVGIINTKYAFKLGLLVNLISFLIAFALLLII